VQTGEDTHLKYIRPFVPTFPTVKCLPSRPPGFESEATSAFLSLKDRCRKRSLLFLTCLREFCRPLAGLLDDLFLAAPSCCVPLDCRCTRFSSLPAGLRPLGTRPCSLVSCVTKLSPYSGPSKIIEVLLRREVGDSI
jgi:hypothetical protein